MYNPAPGNHYLRASVCVAYLQLKFLFGTTLDTPWEGEWKGLVGSIAACASFGRNYCGFRWKMEKQNRTESVRASNCRFSQGLATTKDLAAAAAPGIVNHWPTVPPLLRCWPFCPLFVPDSGVQLCVLAIDHRRLIGSHHIFLKMKQNSQARGLFLWSQRVSTRTLLISAVECTFQAQRLPILESTFHT